MKNTLKNLNHYVAKTNKLYEQLTGNKNVFDVRLNTRDGLYIINRRTGVSRTVYIGDRKNVILWFIHIYAFIEWTIMEDNYSQKHRAFAPMEMML